MIYSQVVWALALDRIIWHVDLNAWTILGVGSVVCSLVLVSLKKEVTIHVQGTMQYEPAPSHADIVAQDIIDMDCLYAYEDTNDGNLAGY